MKGKLIKEVDFYVLKIDDKIQDHKADNKINIQSAGLFGQCSDAITLLFL
jgi:hypothetical protein